MLITNTGVDILTCNPAEAATVFFPVVDEVVRTLALPTAVGTGGYFTMWRRNPTKSFESMPVVGFGVGVASQTSFIGHLELVNQRAIRLLEHEEHISSRQSRVAQHPESWNRHWFGGAIRCLADSIVLSFAGFSGPMDEFIATVVGTRLAVVDQERVAEIIAASRNDFLTRHLAAKGSVSNM